ARIDAGKPLPPRTVAITIDDAYLSVYETAWPLLRKHDLPFALFVATDPVDRGIPGYMDWDQIRELEAGGVEIGSQAVTHPHMPGLSQAA
ncbi:polysaccharide deacetylase family protein, partial [Tritonibacter sp. SIMBA_163]|uniref:polysaccharide deacetylase family protein n=1 Tax=Tritonibacter sp. SIMBA_163 TaxID=3080868 RepID=UPI00397F3B61